MEDKQFKEMFDFITKLLQENPNNEKNLELLKLLINKKSEYDLERLRLQKEIIINNRNNFFQWCMQDAIFKQQLSLLSNGYTNFPFLIGSAHGS